MALRHRHRFSRDIDIFLPNPQYLGYVSPRLSDAAALDDPDYEESAEFVKIRYPEGEVDFVAGPRLTEPGAVDAVIDGRTVRLETDVEIVAKKLYFRGDRLKPRDLFDLALLLERCPGDRVLLGPWATRHRTAMLSVLDGSADRLRIGFEAINTDQYQPSFDDALAAAQSFLRAVAP